MWKQAPEFDQLVSHKWNSRISGAKMYQVVQKLKAAKKELILLNKRGFHDIEAQELMALLHMNECQTSLHANPTCGYS